jgi:hypothetical protein
MANKQKHIDDGIDSLSIKRVIVVCIISRFDIFCSQESRERDNRKRFALLYKHSHAHGSSIYFYSIIMTIIRDVNLLPNYCYARSSGSSSNRKMNLEQSN